MGGGDVRGGHRRRRVGIAEEAVFTRVRYDIGSEIGCSGQYVNEKNFPVGPIVGPVSRQCRYSEVTLAYGWSPVTTCSFTLETS